VSAEYVPSSDKSLLQISKGPSKSKTFPHQPTVLDMGASTTSVVGNPIPGHQIRCPLTPLPELLAYRSSMKYKRKYFRTLFAVGAVGIASLTLICFLPIQPMLNS
jgi:hypothetical protein